ncbi:hypothetical protein EW026_g2840 [Hermanssonia centrifuga]|uniref:U2 snRNP-associated SURP motif-containing protein n=1 Tax=Hermanssonia centrifuga TaxID=98765 RepID=A0A4S4KLZ1_9APHY|nr:hypothetical protein EW026_g2840 [Hermanssonia centrifuga]
MDKTKSKLAAFFDNDDEEPSFPQKPVDDQKLSHYTQGTVRKSKREKEKEAADAKRREEEENAAKAYAEFLDAFQGEEAERKKAGSAFVKSGQEALYQPAAKPRGEPSRTARMFEEDEAPSSPPTIAPKPKGKRAMDSFLEEIKREQASRESKFGRHATQGRSITSMAAYEGQSGSKDRGDPETSNIFVANLPPYVNEQSLGMFFARIGPVGSVKIMWPRGDGTVGPAYMKRKDAEGALRELDGFDWGGSILRVGWSKAVPVAAKPMYGTYSLTLLDINPQGGKEVEVPPADTLAHHLNPFHRRMTPVEGIALHVNRVALLTVGLVLRLALVTEGLATRMQGRAIDPEFDDEGYNSVYSTDSAEDSEREHGRKNQLGRLARRRFEAMLRALSGRRGELARCMAFSLEHAEAASEVVDIIISSLLVDGTPVPRKVARLYLICDILHNSAAPLPMAWKFRQEFQSRLGIVFDHLSTIYHSFPGRITAETFKKQITSIVDIWEDWIVFPPDFTAELRARLEGMTTDDAEEEEEEMVTPAKEEATAFVAKFKASSFKPAEVVSAPPAITDDDDGEPMDEGSDVDGVPVDDVDGEPLATDVDGEPIDDVDGEPMEDVDGVAIDDVDGVPLDDTDVDGEPMDDDLDGAPVAV